MKGYTIFCSSQLLLIFETLTYYFFFFFISPLLVLSSILPAGLKLQQLCLTRCHLVFEVAALDLHALQQPLQLLHLLTPPLRQLLRLLQQLRLLNQTNAVLF